MNNGDLSQLRMLTIDGTYLVESGKRQRYLITVGLENPDTVFVKEITLTGKSFAYLTMLANALTSAEFPGGWIDADQIEPGFNQSRYIWRLRLELRHTGIDTSNLIKANGGGKYRLMLKSDQVEFVPVNLRSFPDFRLAQLFVC